MKKTTTKTREYANNMRSTPAAPAAPAPAEDHRVTDGTTAALANIDPGAPELLGLDSFSLGGADLVPFTPETRQRLDAAGFQQVEKYLSLRPMLVDGQLTAVGIQAFILGWSATLIEDISDATKLRYIRKLHLQLKSGLRASLLASAQLAELFRVPIDGSVSVEIYRGGTTQLGDGRQMGEFGSFIKLDARPPTHAPGKAYAQICGEAALRFQLGSMSTLQLARVEGCPPGLLEPYMKAAEERELALKMAARDAESEAKNKATKAQA